MSHPGCALLRVALFRINSERGGEGRHKPTKNINYSILVSAHQPKCLLVRQRGDHGHPRTP